VLGAAVWEGGVPSPALRRRVRHAVALALSDPRSDLLLTGGLGRHAPSEARAMREVARAAGLPTERLLLEERATSTDESARFCADILRREGFERVTVVTDRYHVRRVVVAFRQAGVVVDAASPPDSDASRGSRAQCWRERGALLWYRLRGIWRRLTRRA